jgi:hypothetical protein
MNVHFNAMVRGILRTMRIDERINWSNEHSHLYLAHGPEKHD